MKTVVRLFGLALGLALAAGAAFGGNSQYTNGVEGAKAPVLPPPGFYLRNYNVFYTAGHSRLDDGRKNRNSEVDVFAFVNRAIYVTDMKFLGADFGMDLVVPLIHADIRNKGAFDDDKFGLGDILVEPLVLAWHGERWDAVLGAGVYAPTGGYDPGRPASPGKGYWSAMFTAGGTVYFDCAKTWHASILARYGTRLSKQRKTHADLGDDFHFEWGVAKSFANGWQAGVAGYAQWQVRGDKFRGQRRLRQKGRVFAVGPEIGYTVAPWKLDINLKSLWEFGARNASEGGITSLTFTKAF